MNEPQPTALYDEHTALGANFTEFCCALMPLRYDSDVAEHHAVRNAAGLFDLSHMGEVEVTGPDAARFLNYALVGDFAALKVGRAKYSVIVNEDGGMIDDLIGYRLDDDNFLVVPNAGNVDAVVAALEERAAGFEVTLRNVTRETSLIAIQGPKAESILASIAEQSNGDADQIAALKRMSIIATTLAGLPVLVARTGYTGEDGFEIYLSNADAPVVWRDLLEAGQDAGLVPVGLAARDSLRLEAALPLYSNDLGLDVTPYEAGLEWLVSAKKTDEYVGREALEARRDTEPERVLVGLRGAGRRAGRSGYAVFAAGADADSEAIGVITSGLPSPTLGYPIALARILREYAEPGTKLEVDLRGKREAFEVVETPFYSRS